MVGFDRGSGYFGLDNLAGNDREFDRVRSRYVPITFKPEEKRGYDIPIRSYMLDAFRGDISLDSYMSSLDNSKKGRTLTESDLQNFCSDISVPGIAIRSFFSYDNDKIMDFQRTEYSEGSYFVNVHISGDNCDNLQSIVQLEIDSSYDSKEVLDHLKKELNNTLSHFDREGKSLHAVVYSNQDMITEEDMSFLKDSGLTYQMI